MRTNHHFAGVLGHVMTWNSPGGDSCPSARSVAAQPAVHGLAAKPKPSATSTTVNPIPDDFHDGVEALLCDCELQEHALDLLASPLIGEAQEARAVVSTINRNLGTHQPESIREASTGSAKPGWLPSCQQSASNKASRRLRLHRVASIPSMC
jgi:hypothetical protein